MSFFIIIFDSIIIMIIFNSYVMCCSIPWELSMYIFRADIIFDPIHDTVVGISCSLLLNILLYSIK